MFVTVGCVVFLLLVVVSHQARAKRMHALLVTEHESPEASNHAVIDRQNRIRAQFSIEIQQDLDEIQRLKEERQRIQQ